MKRIFAIGMILLALFGCKEKDKTADISALYDGDISCTVRIEVQSQPAADYIISFKRAEQTDTVEILSPASVDGITAHIQRGSATISFDGRYLQTLLPSYWGASPADVMSAVFDDLAQSTPQRTVIDEQIMLEYKELTDGVEMHRYVYLNKESLAFEKAEIEIDGEILLYVNCTNFQAY